MLGWLTLDAWMVNAQWSTLDSLDDAQMVHARLSDGRQSTLDAWMVDAQRTMLRWLDGQHSDGRHVRGSVLI